MVRPNLKSPWITTEEVLSKLRERGLEDISQVRVATLEPDGELGVLKFALAFAIAFLRPAHYRGRRNSVLIYLRISSYWPMRVNAGDAPNAID